ncbi:MAG: hypothetical protein COW12_07695, partial [Candidatus Omnitrophica bacterium CG12_big_fil_rev_8_21_14_0_65_45_16]
MIKATHPKQYIWLRIIAMIVIVTFVVTSSDIALAFSVPSPAVFPAGQINQKDKLNKDDMKEWKDLFGDIRYDDPDNPPEGPENPELPPEQGQIPEIPYLPDTPLADIITSFTQNHPLDNPENFECETQGNTTVCTFGEESFVIDDATGRVIQITFLNQSQELQTIQISYDDQNMTMTMRLLNNEGYDTYQTYSMDAEGNPLLMLEVGIVIDEEYVAVRQYDHTTHQVTIYDLDHPGSYSVWNFDENMQITDPVRLVGQYDFGNGYVDVDMEFERMQNGDLRVTDYLTNTFTIYDSENQFKGYGHLEGEQYVLDIEVVPYMDGTKAIIFYHGNGDFAKYEYNAELGTVGRILEYRGLDINNNPVHLGYMYDDANGKLTFLVYDYNDPTHGQFYTADIEPGQMPWEVDFENMSRYGVFTLDQAGLPILKILLEIVGDIWTFYNEEDSRFYIKYQVYGDGTWDVIGARGPPYFEDPNLEMWYDHENNRATVFDHGTLTYAVYVLLPEYEIGQLLESGLFEVNAGQIELLPGPPEVPDIPEIDWSAGSFSPEIIAFFMGNPLIGLHGHEGDCVDQGDGTTRCTYSDGTYYKLENATQHLIALYLLIGEGIYQLLTFTYQGDGVFTIRTHRGHENCGNDPEACDLYEVYQTMTGPNGDVYRLIEHGSINASEEQVAEEIYVYDDNAGTLTITDVLGSYTVIWALDENGLPVRILSFEGEFEGTEYRIEYVYNQDGTFYAHDLLDNTYILFDADGGFLESGTFVFENDEYTYTVLVKLTTDAIFGDVYIFYSESDPSYFRMYARNGFDMGNLLEFYDLIDGELVHYVFLYDEPEEHTVTMIRYLDDGVGVYYRFNMDEVEEGVWKRAETYYEYGSFTQDGENFAYTVYVTVEDGIYTLISPENPEWIKKYEAIAGRFRLIYYKGPESLDPNAAIIEYTIVYDGDLAYKITVGENRFQVYRVDVDQVTLLEMVYEGYRDDLLQVYLLVNLSDHTIHFYEYGQDGIIGTQDDTELASAPGNWPFGTENPIPPELYDLFPAPPGWELPGFLYIPGYPPVFLGNPLIGIHGHEGNCEVAGDIKTCTYDNGEYYKIDLTSGNLIELYLASGDIFQLLTLTYDNGFLTIQFHLEGDDYYETYEILEGPVYRVTETGVCIGDDCINNRYVNRVYAYDGFTLTITDPNDQNYLEQWALNEDGTVKRILRFRGTYDQVDYDVTFIYREDGSYYVLDHLTDTYLIFSAEGEFVESGTFVFDENNQTYVYTTLVRIDLFGDVRAVYLYDAEHPGYRYVYELLEGNQMGRLLEFIGEVNEELVHYVFQYDYPEEGVMTILRYYVDGQGGVYYRVHMANGWYLGGEYDEYGSFRVETNGAITYVLYLEIDRVNGLYTYYDPSNPTWKRIFQEFEPGRFRLVYFEKGVLEHYEFFYDDVNGWVTKMDYKTQTFTRYQLNGDGITFGVILATGSFNEVSHTYTITLVGEDCVQYSYGEDVQIFTGDDEKIGACPVPEPRDDGTSAGDTAGDAQFFGGGGASYDTLIKRLHRRTKAFKSDCEKIRSGDRMKFMHCEDLQDSIESILSKLKNIPP